MKKFFPNILILAVIVGLLIPTHTAHAGLFSWAASVFPPASDFLGGIVTAMLSPVIALFSFILWLSGQLLNFTINYTIIDLKYNLQSLTGINIAWKVVRDLMNIAFIFMLVYEGIILIIGQGSTTQIKKFISGIVLASILINFSLFFTKVMIDASNVVTIGFYKAILGPNANGVDFTVPVIGTTFEYGLSNPIIEKIGISSFYDGGAASIFASGDGITGAAVRIIGAGLVMLVSAFVFFAVSLLFLVRYVTLIILLMLSPVAYMGLGLPFMSKYAKEWWESFKGQLLFAPIYMILTWVVLILMSSPGFVKSGSWNDVFTSGGAKPSFSSLGLLVNFVILIGLIIASLVIAKKTASSGSKLIGQATGKFSAFAGGAVLGGSARLSRNTIGRWGANAANDENLRARAAAGSTMAKLKLASANKAATSSFDARASKTFGTMAGAAGMEKSFGKVDSKKENYRAIREEQEKEAAKKAEMYKPNEAEYAKAKEADEKLKDDIKLAKGMLDTRTDAGKKFEQKENEAKAEHFNSDAWKTSTAGMAEKEALTAVEKHKTAAAELVAKQKDIDKKIKEASESKIIGSEAILKEEIELMKKEAEEKQKEVAELDRLAKEKEGAIKAGEEARKSWVSAEKAMYMKNKDRSEKENVEAQDKIYQSRVSGVAAKVGQETRDGYEYDTNFRSAMRRVGLVVGGAANVVGLKSAPPRTKAEREALARKIRAVPKGKKPKEEFEELLKKAGITEDKDDKKEDKAEEATEPKAEATEETTT